jgi:hypothetical protein
VHQVYDWRGDQPEPKRSVQHRMPWSRATVSRRRRAAGGARGVTAQTTIVRQAWRSTAATAVRLPAPSAGPVSDRARASPPPAHQRNRCTQSLRERFRGRYRLGRRTDTCDPCAGTYSPSCEPGTLAAGSRSSFESPACYLGHSFHRADIGALGTASIVLGSGVG